MQGSHIIVGNNYYRPQNGCLQNDLLGQSAIKAPDMQPEVVAQADMVSLASWYVYGFNKYSYRLSP